MWKITRVKYLCSSSINDNKRIRFPFCSDQNFFLSSLPRSPKLPRSNSTKSGSSTKQPEATTNTASLFKLITDILGSDEVIPDKVSTGVSTSRDRDWEAGLVREELGTCTQSVCEIAEANTVREKDNSSVLNDSQMGNTGEIDVSPMVHDITAIVRAENGVVPMEERLGKLGFQLDQEIVDKVLKRCFKVPQLAFRFFEWVKMRNGFFHTTKTYNSMLYIAGEAKEFELVEKLMGEMERSSCEKDIKTYTILILQYGKAKLISKALMVFEKMSELGCEPDAEAYRTLIRSLCTAGEVEIAFEFYREMVSRDMGLDIGSYRLLLNSLVRLGDTAAVHSVADSMKGVSQIPEHIIFGCMLKSFCTCGKIREALELIRELKTKEIPFDALYFEILVKGLCRADRIADALEIADIMKKRQLVDGKIYGMIINGYLRKNDLYKALELFESMNESGYTPTSSTYTELMQQLFALNEYQKGSELFDEMLERGIKLDSVAITAMVAGHVRHNQINEAWKVFKSMEDRGIKPTGKSYLVFIQELYKLSRMDEIIKVLNEMKAAKIVCQHQVFRGVIAYLDKRGDKDNAEKVKNVWMMGKSHFQEEEETAAKASAAVEDTHMEARHDQSKSAEADCHQVDPLQKSYNQQDLHEIFGILSSSMDWLFIQEALEKYPIAYTPELVVEILQSHNMHGNAMLRFFSWVGTQPGYRHTTETYNLAIKMAGQGKDFKHMRSLFFEMRRKGCSITPDTWTIMIMQYGRIGLTEIALRTFNEMKANGYNPNGSTYKSLITSLCGRKGRKVDEAIKIFHEMIRTGYIPDKELLEIYLDSLCFSGKLLEAKRCVESICKIGFTAPLSYSMLIRALCRAGRLEEALALVDEVGAERFTLEQYVFASLVHGLLSKGRLKEALGKVDSMKRLGIYPTVHVYTSLMDYFFKEKQLDNALDMFKKMQQEGCKPTVVTYCAMIRGFVNTGQVADAWDIFNRMKVKGPHPGFKAYSIFITCLCRAGRSEEALQLLSEMQNNGIVPSTVNFRTVFYGLNREGKQNIAQTVLKQKSSLINKRKFLT